MNRLARTLLQIAASAGLLLCGTAIAQTSQTITFAAITTRTLDNSPLALTATASSGLPVSFASSTPAVCTVSGATATLLATGSCTITASQAGDGTYSPATPVPRTFAVNKAVQTITFATISTKTLAQTPLALAATSNSGLTVAFSSTTPAVCTVSGATATLLTTGTCSIAANQAGDSYWAAATQVLRSFSVTKASQTITFATLANRTYSPTPFVVTGTSTSGLAVAFAGTTPTICTVATDGGGVSTVTMLAAGTCTVTANQAGNTTYNAATQVSRSFTISKASQTLVIDTIADKNLGDADFQPDVTNSAGLPYTLSTTTTAVCTVANNAVTLVATGTCTVKADAPATPAYNAATQQTKSFTVAAARAPLVYYVHPDQIGSPRVMTKATDNSIVWKWDNEEAFGDNLPNEKPSGTGERFKYDLRFAGQVYDRETATSYNYFRDYDQAEGRYRQSDLVGLAGGINGYTYVGGNPLSFTDSQGLFIDTVLDVGFVGYSLYRLIADGACQRDENWKALALDVAGAAIPGVAGLGSTYRAGRAAAKGVKPDFVVTSSGTAVPVSQSRMREGFDAAGFPGRAADKTAESGVIHTVPTRNGTVAVRTMEGSGHHPRRAVFTREGTNDPVRMDGRQFPNGIPKADRRAGGHLDQTP